MHQGDWLRLLADKIDAEHASEILECPHDYLGDYLTSQYTVSPKDPPSSAARAGHRSRFWTTPAAIDYMIGRGLTEETLEDADIGYDGDTDEITFPIDSPQAEFVNNIRRPLEPPESGRKYKVMAGRTKENGGVQLYPQPFPADGPILLVEGLIDALLLRQEGLPAVTSTHGVGTFLEEWLPLFSGRRVAVAYDVGVAEIQRQRVEQLRDAGADAWGVDLTELGLPDKGDLGDFLLSGGTVQQVKDLIKEHEHRRAR
jgi:DNA primase